MHHSLLQLNKIYTFICFANTNFGNKAKYIFIYYWLFVYIHKIGFLNRFRRILTNKKILKKNLRRYKLACWYHSQFQFQKPAPLPPDQQAMEPLHLKQLKHGDSRTTSFTFLKSSCRA